MPPLNVQTVGVDLVTHSLQSLQTILNKAAAHPDAATFPSARLIDDMKPLTFQVQMVIWAAQEIKDNLAGQTGTSIPTHEDYTMAQLQTLVEKALAQLQGLSSTALDGAGERPVQVKLPSVELNFADGNAYLLGFLQPNVAFHLTTAYNILRSKGVDLGKKDFLDAFLLPNLKQA